MCGISGIYNFSNTNLDSKKIINKIIKLQTSRGPDGNGIWESSCKKITFGHNRLSIIDLSKKADQPFISNDKNLIITFNGEIYNYLELKENLQKKKVIFKSNSDTEVILESYKFWGLDFLKKLRGMYSFAIWDNKNNKLLIARDPFGIKPLYYTIFNGVFYFASQIKSLLSIKNLKFEYCDAGIVSYYLWGNVQEPFTLYKNIKSINRGCCLIIEKNGIQKSFNYADIKDSILNVNEVKFKNENAKLDYLKDIIYETVNYHQVSDVPRTIMLSAGIDSNLILASISDKNKKNCSALTLDFNYKGADNEIFFAKESANLNKIKHQIINLSEDEFSMLISHFFENMDSPTNDGFNNYIISYLAKKNDTKIIISGIGGDELLAGYPSFNIIPKINMCMKFIPESKILKSLINNKLFLFLKKRKMKTKYSGILDYGRNISSAFLLVRSLFLPNEINELIDHKSFKNGYEELDIENALNKDIDEIKDTRLSIMYLEIKYYLCSKLLRDSDWASMANSVELRTPFVDWSFFNKLIPLIKNDKSTNKEMAVNSMNDKLPKNIINRKKTGFVIPHNLYLQRLSFDKKYANPIRDWSILSYEKYLQKKTN
tara:strand:- start:3501 stop:5303 length:1803 start_codon:yes stop_codon:yes gene_type:complete